MKYHLTHKVTLLLFLFLFLFGLTQTTPIQAEWFRGNMHCHSQWSDGTPMPEWVLAWYKEKGYHFICLSDHNIFQSNELIFNAWCYPFDVPDPDLFKNKDSRWKYVNEKGGWNQLTPKSIQMAKDKFGAENLVTLDVGDKTVYRLKTYDELVEQFVEPGKFLMIPGFEQTGAALDGHQVHMNFIGVTDFFPYIAKKNPIETLKANFERGKEFFKNNPQPYLFTLNHPIWRYYDVSPEDLLALPEIRYFELNNAGLSWPAHEKGWGPEKFWDVVNAFRTVRGQQLLLGFGSDDEHSYSKPQPRAWTVANAKELSWPALLDAFSKSDFYATNGLDFDTIAFDAATKTLRVKIKAETGKVYRIDFIGTKAGFNQKHEVLDVPKTNFAKSKKGPAPARKLDLYSDEIGVVLKSIDGTEGSYTLADDDLYVRARIVTVPGGPKQDELLAPAAWTQPYSVYKTNK